MDFNNISEYVGRKSLSIIEEFGEITELAIDAIKSVYHGKVHSRLIFDQMVKIGIESLPIAVTSAFFVGMVFAVQIGTEFLKFGAGKFIGGVMGIAVARELAPALTGIVIASRVSAAIAAEIGTMNVTQQIDAIKALGSNPVRYLVAPRLIAATLMLPLLTVLADIFCFFGGFLVAVLLVHVSAPDYMLSAQQLVKMGDIYGGIAKSFVFGIVISIIACYRGLNAKGGAKGVGEATTSSVVSSLIALFIFNYFLSVLFFK